MILTLHIPRAGGLFTFQTDLDNNIDGLRAFIDPEPKNRAIALAATLVEINKAIDKGILSG